ncbi:hypothetical protein PR048_002036 [Dryococelus australis]|uniref:Uncharacterized protein n=1 Tax=Dryococelus australis TaxID=614101 RepID=A0ABQ9IK70_9NEOP|nr:hypothetical protein PR048_002036 [Dryococelus australis]
MGFSLKNIIVSPTRNRLLIQHVSSIMFIKLHGPSLKDWNPESYISTWLRSHYSADTKTSHFGLPIGREEESCLLIAKRPGVMRPLARPKPKPGMSAHTCPFYHRDSETLRTVKLLFAKVVWISSQTVILGECDMFRWWGKNVLSSTRTSPGGNVRTSLALPYPSPSPSLQISQRYSCLPFERPNLFGSRETLPREEYMVKGSGWMLVSIDCLELPISRLYSASHTAARAAAVFGLWSFTLFACYMRMSQLALLLHARVTAGTPATCACHSWHACYMRVSQLARLLHARVIVGTPATCACHGWLACYMSMSQLVRLLHAHVTAGTPALADLLACARWNEKDKRESKVTREKGREKANVRDKREINEKERNKKKREDSEKLYGIIERQESKRWNERYLHVFLVEPLPPPPPPLPTPPPHVIGQLQSRGNSVIGWLVPELCINGAVRLVQRHPTGNGSYSSAIDFFGWVIDSSAAIVNFRHDVDSVIDYYGWATYSSSIGIANWTIDLCTSSIYMNGKTGILRWISLLEASDKYTDVIGRRRDSGAHREESPVMQSMTVIRAGRWSAIPKSCRHIADSAANCEFMVYARAGSNTVDKVALSTMMNILSSSRCLRESRVGNKAVQCQDALLGGEQSARPHSLLGADIGGASCHTKSLACLPADLLVEVWNVQDHLIEVCYLQDHLVEVQDLVTTWNIWQDNAEVADLHIVVGYTPAYGVRGSGSSPSPPTWWVAIWKHQVATLIPSRLRASSTFTLFPAAIHCFSAAIHRFIAAMHHFIAATTASCWHPPLHCWHPPLHCCHSPLHCCHPPLPCCHPPLHCCHAPLHCCHPLLPAAIHRFIAAVHCFIAAIHRFPHRFIAAIHRFPAAIHSFIAAIHCFIAAIHRFIAAIHRFPAAIHRFIAAIHRFIAAMHRFIAAIHRFPAAIHHFIAAVHCFIAAIHRFPHRFIAAIHCFIAAITQSQQTRPGGKVSEKCRPDTGTVGNCRFNARRGTRDTLLQCHHFLKIVDGRHQNGHNDLQNTRQTDTHEVIHTQVHNTGNREQFPRPDPRRSLPREHRSCKTAEYSASTKELSPTTTMQSRLDSTVLFTDLSMPTVHWLSAVTVEGDDWASVLKEVSNTVCTND